MSGRVLSAVASGLRLAGRHRGLVVLLWLSSLLPAFAVIAMVASDIRPGLGRSTFADRILTGNSLRVWIEFRDSPLDDLAPILGTGVLMAIVTVAMMQVVLAAGLVEVALGRKSPYPFVLGVRTNLLRFVRTGLVHVFFSGLAIGLAVAANRAVSQMAKTHADGRFDLAAIGAAAVVFLVVWAPLDLASDLSRLAASDHDQRSMTLGYLRALGFVLRRPLTFLPLYGIFLVLPVLVHVLFGAVERLGAQDSLTMLLFALLVQQAAMVGRAFVKLAIWGAEAHVYRAFGSPPLCRPRKKKAGPPAAPEALPSDPLAPDDDEGSDVSA